MSICLVSAFVLGGCASTSHWRFESIQAGETPFDSARLTYAELGSSLRFELLRIETEIFAFLSLTKYSFSSDVDPRDFGTVSDAEVIPGRILRVDFDIGGEKVEETIPFLEGGMRLRLPSELSEKLILALQEGREVAIIVDGFEQHIDPAHFTTAYEKLAGKKAIFRNPFKGLFDP